MDLTEKQERRIDLIAEEYAPRAIALLNLIKAELESHDLTCSEVYAEGADNYRWSFVVYLFGSPDETHEDDVDITVEMNLSEECDGTDNGVTFAVDIVSFGGSIIGGLAPYNYTGQCWVNRDNPHAIEQRFQLLEEADIDSIYHLLTR